jgi:hypothetical protein
MTGKAPRGSETRAAWLREPDETPGASTLISWIAPRSLAEVKELARMIALAEWAPECYRDFDDNYLVPKIELAIMHGASVGLGPIAAVQSIAIINGKPSIWGDGALSVIEHSGLLEDMVETYEVDDEQGLTAICTMKRRGRATPIANRFSTAMADRAGLAQGEGPWQTYLERMLRMRARSWAMRDGFADILRGLHIREEVEDFERTRTSRPDTEQGIPRGAGSASSPRPLRPAVLTTAGLPVPRRTPSVEGLHRSVEARPAESGERASLPTEGHQKGKSLRWLTPMAALSRSSGLRHCTPPLTAFSSKSPCRPGK